MDGAIGSAEENIKADLSAENLNQYCFTDKIFNLDEALKISYSLLNKVDKEVIIPLLGYLYITPLVSILKENDIYVDFILMLIGESGVGKSSIAAIINSHFGNFTRNSFNTSLDDTASKIEKQAYNLKDTILVPDDLNPENDEKKIKITNKIIALFGDRQGRGRITPQGKIRTTYYARGTAIITGEFLPNLAFSRLARVVVLEFTKNTTSEKAILYYQTEKEKLAYTMKKYIEWIINNENDVINTAKTIVQQFENNLIINNKELHGRTREAIAILYIGFNLYVEFLQTNSIISEEEKRNLLENSKEILKKVAQKQAQEIKNLTPTEMFYNAIEQLIQTNRINLLDFKNCSTIDFDRKRIDGFIDNETKQYYFYPETIYSAVCKFYSEAKNPFNISLSTLLKELHNSNALYMTDPSRKTVIRVNPITKEKMRVIAVKMQNNESIKANNEKMTQINQQEIKVENNEFKRKEEQKSVDNKKMNLMDLGNLVNK